MTDETSASASITIKPKITPGTYRLSETVKNPEADRRYKNDYYLQGEFEAGDEFIVEAYQRKLDGTEELKAIEYTVLKLTPVSAPSAYVYDHDPRFEAIMKKLEPIEESLEAFMTRLGVHSYANQSFVRWLVSSEAMTRKMFEYLYNSWLNEAGVFGSSKLFVKE